MSIKRANFSGPMRYLIWSAIAFILWVGLPAKSEAQVHFLILIEGPAAGTNLFAIGNTVPPLENLPLQADGRIGTGPECLDERGNEAPHYHGSLFGQPDPNPGGCGWGRVALRAGLSLLLSDLVGAIELEELPLFRTVMQESPLWSSIYFLARTLERLTIRDNPPQDAVALLRTAAAFDIGALRAFNDGNLQVFESLLREALELKRAAFLLLLRAGL